MLRYVWMSGDICYKVYYLMPDTFINVEQDYCHKVIDSWKEGGLDAVICPPKPFPALPRGNAGLAFGK